METGRIDAHRTSALHQEHAVSGLGVTKSGITPKTSITKLEKPDSAFIPDTEIFPFRWNMHDALVVFMPSSY
jgi:hypothetical protein